MQDTWSDECESHHNQNYIGNGQFTKVGTVKVALVVVVLWFEPAVMCLFQDGATDL